MNDQTIKQVLQHWDIETSVTQIYASTWAVGDRNVIKGVDHFTALERNQTVMKALHEAGIPVACAIPTRDGNTFVEHEGYFYTLMPRLKGKHIEGLDDCDMDYEVGVAIGKLHKAFQQVEKTINPPEQFFMDELEGWILETLEEQALFAEDLKSAKALIIELKESISLLPKQMIHRDIHFGNLLFHENALSGYIDFDLTHKNIRVFDLAYFLTGLSLSHYQTPEGIQRWHAFKDAFLEGYETEVALSETEKKAIPLLMPCIELLFVAYFTNKKMPESTDAAIQLYRFLLQNDSEL